MSHHETATQSRLIAVLQYVIVSQRPKRSRTVHSTRAMLSRVILLVSHFRKHYFDSNALLHTFRTRDPLSPDKLSTSIQDLTL